MTGERKRGMKAVRGESAGRAAVDAPWPYPRPAVAVDVVVLTVTDTDLKVLLVERGGEPFRGSWALPGGFVRVQNGAGDQGEDLDAAAHRELAEETGLPARSVFLEQLYTFGRAGRDPRMRVVSVAHYALVRADWVARIQAGSDAAAARWFSCAAEVPRLELAFDHAEILAMAVARIRGKIDYTPIAFELVPATFTVAELRAVHEAVKGTTYDPANFRRRFKRMLEDGIIALAPGKRATASKPALVYRFTGKAEPLQP